MMKLFAALLAGMALTAGPANAEQVGEVNTAFKIIGPDHKILVDVFDDPRVQGISCYLSRAKTGGITGALGLAEDKADASVSCGQAGDIRFLGALPRQEEVFTVKASILFKHMRVVRMVDPKRNTLVYMVYSDRLVDGSPKSSVTHVPIPTALKIPVM